MKHVVETDTRDERGFAFRMISTIRFNRPINRDTDYISPGGYDMTMNGKSVTFDFEDYEGTINPEDPSVLTATQMNPDYEAYPDLEALTVDDLQHLEAVNEFSVYTGEENESDLECVGVEHLTFEVIPKEGESFEIEYDASDIDINI